MSIQRKVGHLFAVFGALAVVANIVNLAATYKLGVAEVVQHSTVGPVALTIGVLVAFSFIDSSWARGGQVVLTFAFAAPVFLHQYNSLFGLGFIVMGTVLAFSYGWFRRYPWIKSATVLLYTFALMLLGAYADGPGHVVSAVNGIIYLSLVLAFLRVVYSRGIRTYVDSERRTRQELEQNQSWIEHGRNVGHIAHNFKGKLAVIDGYLQLLQLEAGESERSHIQVARRAVGDLGTMTRHMVFAGKARRRREVEPVSLSMVLESIVQQYSVDRENSDKASIVLSGCPGLRLISAPADLMQLFDNLIRNAYDAIESKGRISITVRHTADGVDIEIEDTGVGIGVCERCADSKAEQSSCLWCTEFQEGRTTKPHGSGFGMVYVQRTLSKYDAKLRIISRVGQGTRVRLSFPNKAVLYEESLRSGRRRGATQDDGVVSPSRRF